MVCDCRYGDGWTILHRDYHLKAARMLLVSTGFKSAILGPKSFAQIMNGGTIQVFSGSRPSTADMPAPAALLLATFNRARYDGGLLYQQAGPYMLIPTGDRWQLTPIRNGTATWFRVVTATDSNQTGYTDARIDGDVGVPLNPKEMVLQTASLVAGTVVSVDSFLFSIPPT